MTYYIVQFDKMGDRSFINTSKDSPFSQKSDFSGPRSMFEYLKHEQINPWEMGLIDLNHFVNQPIPHEQTFPESTVTTSKQPSVQSSHSDGETSIPAGSNPSLRNYQSKNKNVLKFVMKLLRDHPDILRESFGQQYSDSFQKVHQYLNNLFEWHRQSPPQHNINKDHLKWILEGMDEEAKVRSSRARLALRSILAKNMGKLSLRNNRCRSKLIYLNALKVYQLRCCNSGTAMRLQS